MAALKITKEGIPLPKALEIMLTKQEATEPESELPTVTPEELEERYQAAIEHVAEQRSRFLPDRRGKVTALKEEIKEKDSFKPPICVSPVLLNNSMKAPYFQASIIEKSTARDKPALSSNLTHYALITCCRPRAENRPGTV